MPSAVRRRENGVQRPTEDGQNAMMAMARSMCCRPRRADSSITAGRLCSATVLREERLKHAAASRQYLFQT